jgi:hypothetical protein
VTIVHLPRFGDSARAAARCWTDGFAEVEFADRGRQNGVRARICWPAVYD